MCSFYGPLVTMARRRYLSIQYSTFEVQLGWDMDKLFHQQDFEMHVGVLRSKLY